VTSILKQVHHIYLVTILADRHSKHSTDILVVIPQHKPQCLCIISQTLCIQYWQPGSWIWGR